MNWVYDDGGRKAAGFLIRARDCVIRAIAIGSMRDYGDVYGEVIEAAKQEHGVCKVYSHPKYGIFVRRQWFKDYMRGHSWQWVKGKVRMNEVPSQGRHIVHVSRHTACVVNGVLHDISDCSRDGMRMVYGYWSRA